jgi:hypothetical protein
MDNMKTRSHAFRELPQHRNTPGSSMEAHYDPNPPRAKKDLPEIGHTRRRTIPRGLFRRIMTSSTVLAPLGPLPIKAEGARRPPAAQGQGILRINANFKMTYEKKMDGRPIARRTPAIPFMAELFGRSGWGEIGSVQNFALIWATPKQHEPP